METELHGDPRERAVVVSASLPWEPWRGGVERKLFEMRRDGAATMLLRLAAGASLEPFEHAGCEDVWILEGELDTYGAHTFLHDPPGSHPARSSRGGATLLLKLQPARALDRRRVIADGRALPGPHHREGLTQTPLFSCGAITIVLLHFAPQSSIGPHRHHDGEEFFVLDGSLSDEHGAYETHTWVRQPCGTVHSVVSESGCTLFSIAGHLLSQ